MNSFFGWTVLICIGFVFFLCGLFFLDPDLGFHLRMGQVIQKQGVPDHDLFSYTMPGYPDIDEAWLLDIGLWHVYSLAGMEGLSVLFALFALGACIVSSQALRHARRTRSQSIVLFMMAAAVLPFAGVRPQVVTWFFLSLVLYITLESEHWYRWRWVLPLLFLFWANMHGGFIAGLATVAFVMGVRWIRSLLVGNVRGDFVADVLILLLCILATLINPYGLKLYTEEILVNVSDSSQRWRIAEWYPTVLQPSFSIAVWLMISVFFVGYFRSIFSLEQISVYCVFLFAALSGLRHVPLWSFAALPLTIAAVAQLHERVRGIPFGAARLRKGETGLLIASVTWFSIQSILLTGRSEASLRREWYPAGAVAYLKQFPTTGNLLADHGWGGYLIWQLPEKKTFIDGRMNLWQRDTAPEGESRYAFGEYIDIISRKTSVSGVLDRYSIDTVLWQQEESIRETQLNTVLTQLKERFISPISSPVYPPITDQLLQSGWRIVYQDQVAVVLRREISM